MADVSMEEARARMIAKRFGGNTAGASTGGEGSARRKKKASTKVTSNGKIPSPMANDIAAMLTFEL